MYSMNVANVPLRQPTTQWRKTNRAHAGPSHTPSGRAGAALPLSSTSRSAVSCITLEEAMQQVHNHNTAEASRSLSYAEVDAQPSTSSMEIQAALLSQLAAFSRELLESAPWDPQTLDEAEFDVANAYLLPSEVPTCPVDLMQNLAATTRRMLSYEPVSSFQS